MPQRTVIYRSKQAYFGMITSGDQYNVRRGTRGELINGLDTPIPWGRGVTQEPDTPGSGGGGSVPGGDPNPVTGKPGDPSNIVLPTAGDQIILGVTYGDEWRGIKESIFIGGGERGYLPKKPLGMLTQGDIAVPIERGLIFDVRPNQAVSCSINNAQPGVFANTEDGNHIKLDARWLDILYPANDDDWGMGIINLGSF